MTKKKKNLGRYVSRTPMNIKINRREESSWKSEGNTESVEEITGRLNTRWGRVYDQA